MRLLALLGLTAAWAVAAPEPTKTEPTNALEAAAKVSVAAAPAVGRVSAPTGYVAKAEVLPVRLIDGPAQPAP